MTRRSVPAAVVAGVLGLAAAAAACGGGGSTPRVASVASAAHPAAARPATTTQLIHTAAQCLRDHGIPGFPDPVIDTRGRLQVDNQLLNSLPASVTQAAEQACRPQIDAAQTAAEPQRPDASPQDLARATAFARCMRQHGWPRFPDPDAHGGFSSANPGDLPPTKNDPAFQTCRSVFAGSNG